MTTTNKLLIYNLKQIVQIVEDTKIEYLKGKESCNNIKIINDYDNKKLCISCGNDGVINYVGNISLLPFHISSYHNIHDSKGGIAIPGFVDGHTHPVFAGDRVHEFAMKLAGASYMDVQAAGGGIHFTTTKTNEACKDDLLEDFKIIADQMIQSGTTTIEAKSGYGLNTECEVKMLQVLETASHLLPLEISATFCGGHAVPKGSDERKQTDIIIKEMIPKLKKMKENNELTCLENIDVFCEKNVFEIDNSKKILKAGNEIGLNINFHGDELTPLGGAEMGASINAKAISHLEEVSEDGIKEMALKGSVAVLLPTTASILKLPPPPARKMIEEKVIVALGSDFNPNAYCYAMPTVMHLACITFRMSMTEALVASTINSAHSIGRGSTHGAISLGRFCDVILLDANSWEHIIYRLSGHQHIIKNVIKKGQMVL
uniref:Probable imidazolonepropionase n=1 Tax=Parastrongyloides trichosuri TaxID=131310 RepID=A0A0N4ZY24_PARTI